MEQSQKSGATLYNQSYSFFLRTKNIGTLTVNGMKSVLGFTLTRGRFCQKHFATNFLKDFGGSRHPFFFFLPEDFGVENCD